MTAFLFPHLKQKGVEEVMSVLDSFSLAAKWSPYLLTFIAVVIGLYLYAVGPGRRHFSGSEPVPVSKKLWFISGMILVYAAFGSPIDILGHFTFTFHMVSMVLAFIVAPPLMLRGIPEWMLLPIGKIPGIRRFKFLLHPLVTLFPFNILFSIYHFPAVLDAMMTNIVWHTIYYFVMFITATLMWFPTISPVSAFDKLEGFKKMIYLFANSIALLPACALIIFSPKALYGTYTDPAIWAQAMALCIPAGASVDLLALFPSGAQALGWMDPLTDQQTGGVIMKLSQEVIYGGILIYIILQWFKKDNPHDSDEAMEPTAAYYEMIGLKNDPTTNP